MHFRESILQKLCVSTCKKKTPDHLIQIMRRYRKRKDSIDNFRSSFLLKTYFPEYLVLILFVAALLWAADCRADNVTLAWDASPDPVTGYTVFYGEESILTNPSTPKPVGNVLQCTITGLLPGTYYFAIKASYYNNESSFSNEVTCTVPDDDIDFNYKYDDSDNDSDGKKCPLVNLLGENNPDLATMRSFRDTTLAKNAIGRKIISIYYNNADSINAALENSPPLRAFTREALETIAPMMER